MLAYQVRPRVFRLEDGDSLSFPSAGEVRFVFGPLQPFGVEPGPGRTVVRGVAAKLVFNANTGAQSIQSDEPLTPLDVELVEPLRNVRLEGNVLTITQDFGTKQELTALIQAIYFGLPPLLNVEFADPPVIERVDGVVGETKFRWELAEWKAEFRPTTQDQQENTVATCWERIGLLSVATNTRLFAALHYYYVAVRLQRQGSIPGEFLPEMILNLAKVLEVLFPPGGDGKSRESARRGLRVLGFAEIEIEADYIPALALRNEIDVGHVDLGLFSASQLVLIHGYVQRAEDAFRDLFQRLFDKIQAGQFTVAPYTRTSVGSGAARVVARLAQYADRYAL